ncbi:MAG: acyl-homoserine-lactone synthase [Planktomarina sp.]
MLNYIYGSDLDDFPQLRDTMFQDRAKQFRDRMGWDVTVNEAGFELDEYDEQNPLYVICADSLGDHAGSLRLLPTTGDTMVNDHFSHLAGGHISSPFIWECTRFCLAPGSRPRVAAALMLAGGEVLTGFDISHFVGVFDASMRRIYKMIGAEPEVLGSDGGINVGLWSLSAAAQAKVAHKAGVSLTQSRAWFDASFDQVIPRLRA